MGTFSLSLSFFYHLCFYLPNLYYELFFIRRKKDWLLTILQEMQEFQSKDIQQILLIRF